MEFASAFMSQPFNVASLTNFSALSAKTQKHLIEVYKALAWALGMAAVGVYVETKLMINPTICLVLTVLALIWLGCMSYDPYDGAKQQKRFLVFTAFSFLKGCTIAPLVFAAFLINPSLVFTAFVSCAAIFGCFSLAALNAQRRSMLFLMGALSSAVSTMCLLSFLNLFMHSPWIYLIHLYGGLLVFVGYVMYDTQLIVEKSISQVHPDALRHALDLFIDFVAIFVRILIILLQQQDKKRKEQDKKRESRK